jgi:hypothetical protein
LKTICLLTPDAATLFLHRARRHFLELWREQNVGGEILQMDHHCKALKVQFLKHRFTIFNEFGQPLLGIAASVCPDANVIYTFSVARFILLG